ncbi:hypothetical protein DFH07DRAFT_771067 [Mycena maculata]|uniref:Uncharacterized protein n=1 Tax=Mycena maculata TaxID=230809 RepID=A0AAD7JGJ0_9AGAR|nr:hypothetical protein DFH07DRAFT_771067 [Mycena maculata]
MNILSLRAHITDIESLLPIMELVEEYEVMLGALQAYNDRIFDLLLGNITKDEKDILKDDNFGYREWITPLDKAFNKVCAVLTESEWDLCDKLEAHLQTLQDPRNMVQHPRPDRATVKWWLQRMVPEHEDTFLALLDSNLLRIKTTRYDDEADRRLVVAEGEYEGKAQQWAMLEGLRRWKLSGRVDSKLLSTAIHPMTTRTRFAVDMNYIGVNRNGSRLSPSPPSVPANYLHLLLPPQHLDQHLKRKEDADLLCELMPHSPVPHSPAAIRCSALTTRARTAVDMDTGGSVIGTEAPTI